MRALACAVVVGVALWGTSLSAQMRGGATHVASSGGFRGGFSGRTAIAARGFTGGTRLTGRAIVSPRVAIGSTFAAPGFKTSRVFPGAGRRIPSCFGFPCITDRILFGTPVLGRGRFHNGFGFGQFPFFGAGSFGFPYYGYGGYASDFGDSYDQQELYQQEVAQNARLQTEMQEDQRQQFELAQQLADQRAADAASRAQAAHPQSPPQQQPVSTPTERESPPTVLVFRDHHQVDIRSYAIAGNTLYEFAPHWTRKISLSELDIPATIAANEERGVQFSVPNYPSKPTS